MLVPSGYLAYSLYSEQQFKKNTDVFINSQFTEKGYTVVYKKTDFKARPKKIELALLNKRFTGEELKIINGALSENRYLKGTSLLIRQDSTDRLSALRTDILKQIRTGESEINEKDIRIFQLEKELKGYRFDTPKLLNEAVILFPDVTSLSVGKHTVIGKDTTYAVTAVLYSSRKRLTAGDSDKFKKWLNERLALKNVSVFRKEE